MKINRELEELLGRFAALGDMVRLRMLALLGCEELTVGELAKILQLPQSTVSRHLKLLSDGGWIVRRSAGTASFYHMLADDLDPTARQLWDIARRRADHTPQHERDVARLAQILATRQTDTHSFFGRVGGEWDAMRSTMFGSLFTWQALLSLLPPDITVADLGCGTGNAAELLAPHVREVIAVDVSGSMLKAARKQLRGFGNVTFKQADVCDLPLKDDSIDAAVCVLVLHHIENPAEALGEMCRIVRPGGSAIIVDMMAHEHETYRHTMGHRHLGFSHDVFAAMTVKAGFSHLDWQPIPPDPDARGPQLFAATARTAAAVSR
ncbi:MAG: metalloregulator ArsR/SmtB family transcription factor [Phycisphaerales bacterium]|nr:metalloregulator ArsR/SmtB family transcription factor [Phycisphaerales bacterium]